MECRVARRRGAAVAREAPVCDIDVDMLAMASSAPDDVWAVGTHVIRGSGHPLIEHWNGRQWTVSLTEDAAGAFNDVLALSRRDAWAIGWRHVAPTQQPAPVVMHWNGACWRSVKPPRPGVALIAISGIRGAVWGIASWGNVAYAATSGSHPRGDHYAFARWDGHRWILVKAPKANRISDFAVVSPTEIFAVGDTRYVSGQGEGVAWRWNGKKWSLEDTPKTGAWSSVDAHAGTVWALDREASTIARRCY